MNENNSGNKEPNQRVCDRLNIPRRLLLELDNGKFLGGISVDMSPRGALMNTDNLPRGELVGIAGTLFIISDEGEYSYGYPCKVVRQKGRSVALEIHKKAAAMFGDYLTKDLLGR